MSEDPIFQTETMADVWCKQGRYSEAIRIYAALLEKDPARCDLFEKLAATRKAYEEQEPIDSRTDKLLQQWIEALLLKRHQTDLQAIRPGWTVDPDSSVHSRQRETKTTGNDGHETIRH